MHILMTLQRALRVDQVDARKIALPIVVVNVKFPGQVNYIRALALLDPGSNRTVCSTTLLDELGLDGEKTTLSLETVTTEGRAAYARVVSLEVDGTSRKRNKRTVIKLPRVYALPRFPTLQGSVADPKDVRKWDYLQDLNIPQIHHLPETTVFTLIEQDVPGALLPLGVRSGREGEPSEIDLLVFRKLRLEAFPILFRLMQHLSHKCLRMTNELWMCGRSLSKLRVDIMRWTSHLKQHHLSYQRTECPLSLTVHLRVSGDTLIRRTILPMMLLED
jgi:hypothetical protein